MRTLSRIGAAAMLASASGCATEETMRLDGLTQGAGNAMAANTVMQMVDPWPEGVERTRLRVPANRGAQPSAAPKAVEEKASQPTAGY